MTNQEAMKLSPENNTKLRKEIVACFDKQEIIFLCDDLGVNYQNLPGTTLEDTARELIKYLERRQRIPDLIRMCEAKRPKGNWNKLVKELDHSTLNNQEKKRTVLDAAIKKEIKVGESTFVLVLVRDAD